MSARGSDRRLRGTALLLLAGGVVLGAVTRLSFGPPLPVVRVVWHDVGPGQRRYLERRFGLAEPHEIMTGKWAYSLRDTSYENRKALATQPDVLGVEGIDARTYEVSALMPRAAWRHGAIAVPEPVAVTLEIASLVLVVAGFAASFMPVSAIQQFLALARRTLSWLERGISTATPEAAAAFRMVFGSLVVIGVVSEPAHPDLLRPFALAQAAGPYGELVRWLARHPEIAARLQSMLAVTGVMFVAGLGTRLSFACFAILVVVWASVFTLNTGAHQVSAIQLALLALLAAPWGDAWSLDAWLRRVVGRETRREVARAYGYVFWAPGLVLAVAFAAAAWSKVREGPGWILNGTVKYHFVTDLQHAWVSWGPWLTRWHLVAVAMGAFAVAVEALLITGLFSRSYAYRAVLGAAAAALLAGFALFQGVMWVGWWILLLSFLPWHLIGRDSTVASSPTRGRVTAAQLAAIVLVIGQQVYIAAKHIEARPMLSSYDMYSTTYATPEEYEAAANLVYRVVDVSDGRSSELAGCVVDDHVAAIARRALGGDTGELSKLRLAMPPCVRARADMRQMMLEGDRRVFLWNESRFAWKRRLDVIGPIDADFLRQ